MKRKDFNLHGKTMNIKEHNFDWGKRTYIMGILNVTPDSFSDGGEHFSIDKAVEHAKKMVEDGADIIDIGGESSRPGHVRITAEKEIERVLPVIKRLSSETETILSLDTIRADVAEEGITNGIHIINDIWGLQGDPDMAEIVAKYNVPIVIMHNRDNKCYENDIIKEMIDYYSISIEIALDAGINTENIIIDPGIGFGKTMKQNIEVMSRLDEIKNLGYPVLLATSRKSTIGKILDLPPKERVEGTLATTVLGIMQGIDIVRVHDVKENYRAAKVADVVVRRN